MILTPIFKKLFNWFNDKHVKLMGLALCIAGVFGLHGGPLIGYSIGVAAAALGFYYPKAYGFVAKDGFADPNYWPSFVAMGIATLFAAHQGGWHTALPIAGVFTALDGLYFDPNY